MGWEIDKERLSRKQVEEVFQEQCRWERSAVWSKANKSVKMRIEHVKEKQPQQHQASFLLFIIIARIHYTDNLAWYTSSSLPWWHNDHFLEALLKLLTFPGGEVYFMEVIKKYKLESQMDLDSKPIQLGCPHLYRSMSEKLLNSAVPYFWSTNEALNNLKCMLKTKNNNLHKGLEHIADPQSSSSFLGTVHNLQTPSMVVGQIMRWIRPQEMWTGAPAHTVVFCESPGNSDHIPKLWNWRSTVKRPKLPYWIELEQYF